MAIFRLPHTTRSNDPQWGDRNILLHLIYATQHSTASHSLSVCVVYVHIENWCSRIKGKGEFLHSVSCKWFPVPMSFQLPARRRLNVLKAPPTGQRTATIRSNYTRSEGELQILKMSTWRPPIYDCSRRPLTAVQLTELRIGNCLWFTDALSPPHAWHLLFIKYYSA